MIYVLDSNIISYMLKSNETILNKYREASVNNCTLITNNTNHFNRIDGLSLINWI